MLELSWVWGKSFCKSRFCLSSSYFSFLSTFVMLFCILYGLHFLLILGSLLLANKTIVSFESNTSDPLHLMEDFL